VPSVSKKQHNFMAAIANNPSFAKKVGIKQSVGKEFTAADKGKKFKEGGMAESKKMVKKEVSFMKKKGAPKSMIKHEMGEMMGMKKGGAAKTKKMAMGGYADGGMPMVMKDGKKVPAFAADGEGKMRKGGMTMKKMASGGLAAGHKSADGVASKGKTKAMMPKMAGNKGMKKGGYC
jgi:hypothetical protein